MNPAASFHATDRDVARFARRVRASRGRGRVIGLCVLVVAGLVVLSPLAGRGPDARWASAQGLGRRSGVAWTPATGRLPVQFDGWPWFVHCNEGEACEF